jgi:alkaline phosphatase
MKGKYVDGFVLVVPKKKLGAYRKMAEEGKKMWMKHGALDYKECVGDDLTPDMGMPIMTFPRMAKTKPGETVVFSYIVYKSRAHRDQVNKRVMKEMEKSMDKNMQMPFDMKKMAYGGFRVMVGV